MIYDEAWNWKAGHRVSNPQIPLYLFDVATANLKQQLVVSIQHANAKVSLVTRDFV